VLARLECRHRNIVVRRSGDDDRDCVYVFQQRGFVGIPPDAELAGNLERALVSAFDEAGELNRLHVAKNPDVMIPETAGTDHANAKRLCQMTTPRPLASTKRISSLTSGYISSSFSAAFIACERFMSERKNNRYARFSSRTTASENPLR
jgi:hypothetical protein